MERDLLITKHYKPDNCRDCINFNGEFCCNCWLGSFLNCLCYLPIKYCELCMDCCDCCNKSQVPSNYPTNSPSYLSEFLEKSAK